MNSPDLYYSDVWSSIASYMREAIVIIDGETSKVKFLNEAATLIFHGLKEGDVWNQTLRDPVSKLPLIRYKGTLKYEGNDQVFFLSVKDFNLPDTGDRFLSFIDRTEDYLRIMKLKESERTLSKLIDLVPHAIFLKDSQRRFVIINKAVADHHNLSKKDMLGKKDEDFFDLADAEKFIRDEELILDNKEPLQITGESFTGKDGKKKTMETIKVPFFIQSMDQWGILGVAIDITKRKELQEKQTRLTLNYQKELMNAVINTQERERLKISRDLHDGLGQILTAAKMNINAFRSQDKESKDLLLTSEQLLQDAIREVRNITTSLVPGVLNDFGLDIALEKLVELTNAASETDFKLSIHNLRNKLNEDLENNLYRVCQEILNNALKHSKAEEVTVQLFKRENELVLQVEDDGVGFDFQTKLKAGKGLGLKNIMNRVDLLNGTLDIDTSPGRGCSYSIIIPTDDDQ